MSGRRAGCPGLRWSPNVRAEGPDVRAEGARSRCSLDRMAQISGHEAGCPGPAGPDVRALAGCSGPVASAAGALL